jgi:hypothetical protein
VNLKMREALRLSQEFGDFYFVCDPSPGKKMMIKKSIIISDNI